MFKKSLLLTCATITACAPLVANDDATKGKCKTFNSLNVCNGLKVGGSVTVGGSETIAGNLAVTGNETVGGTLTVGGVITAAGFITPTGGPLRNWAVFSNQSTVTNGTIVPFAATPVFNNTAGITNAAGVITLPTVGVFLVMYTVRVEFTSPEGVLDGASAQLQQGAGITFNPIGQPAITNTFDSSTATTVISPQISGYAIVTTTTITNNQIELLVDLGTGFTMPPAGGTDANAQLTILQLS